MFEFTSVGEMYWLVDLNGTCKSSPLISKKLIGCGDKSNSNQVWCTIEENMPA